MVTEPCGGVISLRSRSGTCMSAVGKKRCGHVHARTRRVGATSDTCICRSWDCMRYLEKACWSALRKTKSPSSRNPGVLVLDDRLRGERGRERRDVGETFDGGADGHELEEVVVLVEVGFDADDVVGADGRCLVS